MKTNKKGFTLIEILVVVLIIGILAGIALPQYQKSVTKSKSAQLLTLVSTIAQSAQNYYMIHDRYPIDFDDIDVELDWPTSGTSVCSVSRPGNKSVKSGNKSEIILNMESADGNFATILGVIADGPYKCTGFVYFLKGVNVPLNRLICTEDSRPQHRGSKSQRGAFCEDIMNMSYQGTSYSWYQFI